MATTQATPDPTQGVPIPAGGSTSTAVAQPLGVPYYITDPATGQPALGPTGQRLRWGASVPSPPSGPGSRGTQGPGTASSTGYDYVLPRYFDGDQWLPAQLPPDQLASLQRKMVAAGLMKPGAAQLGVWDPTSMNAYTQLLTFANAGGLDVSTALDRWGQAHQADPNAGRAPLTVRTTNPDDLKAVFRKAYMDTTGFGVDDAKLNQMVASYQGQETGAQTQAYNQQVTGGTTVAPPSAQTFAATQARAEDPQLAQEHDLLTGPLASFKSMLAGWQ